MNSRILVCAGLLWIFSLSVACAQSHAQTDKSENKAAKVDPSSQWPYEYMRGAVTVPCPDHEEESCIWHRLVVDNQSDKTLECLGHLTYDSINLEQRPALEHRLVMVPHSRKAVLGDMTKPNVTVTSHDVQCVVRPPPDEFEAHATM